MSRAEEKQLGYFTSSGTRAAIPLLTDHERIGVNETTVETHHYYSKCCAELRPKNARRWSATRVISIMHELPVPKQSLT